MRTTHSHTSMSEDTPSIEPTILVAIGGSLGAMARYGVDVTLPSALVATLLVNVLGSFALGVVFFGNRRRNLLSDRLTVLVATGGISSFTTYSTFVIDAIRAEPLVAGGYVLGSYVIGFGAVVAGRMLVGGHRRPRSSNGGGD